MLSNDVPTNAHIPLTCTPRTNHNLQLTGPLYGHTYLDTSRFHEVSGHGRTWGTSQQVSFSVVCHGLQQKRFTHFARAGRYLTIQPSSMTYIHHSNRISKHNMCSPTTQHTTTALRPSPKHTRPHIPAQATPSSPAPRASFLSHRTPQPPATPQPRKLGAPH